MPGSSVHRTIENLTVSSGDQPALACDGRLVSYRELNQRANGIARRLIASGLHRTSTAIVNMEPSAGAALVLLAVLKAGAAYLWLDDGNSASWPKGLSIPEGTGDEVRYRALDLTQALADVQPGPNLPIITRPSDIACVLSRVNGAPDVLVPHETITRLRPGGVPNTVWWSGDAGAIDLWVALMAGATVSVTGAAVGAAAA